MNANRQSIKDLHTIQSIDRNVLKMKDGCLMTFKGFESPRFKIPFTKKNRGKLMDLINRRTYINRTLDQHVRNHTQLYPFNKNGKR